MLQGQLEACKGVFFWQPTDQQSMAKLKFHPKHQTFNRLADSSLKQSFWMFSFVFLMKFRWALRKDAPWQRLTIRKRSGNVDLPKRSSVVASMGRAHRGFSRHAIIQFHPILSNSISFFLGNMKGFSSGWLNRTYSWTFLTNYADNYGDVTNIRDLGVFENGYCEKTTTTQIWI